MLQQEWTQLTGNDDFTVYQLMEAVYGDDGATPKGGHEGHEAVARFFKRNRAAVEAMAGVVKRMRHTASVEVDAMHSANETLKDEARVAARRIADLEREVAAVRAHNELERQEVERLRESIAREDARHSATVVELGQAQSKLYTLARAARIMDELKAEVSVA